MIPAHTHIIVSPGVGAKNAAKTKREAHRKNKKSQITDRLIPLPTPASGGEKGAEEGFFFPFFSSHPFAMAAYFFVLIPPRLLTSKAPALWRRRTECDWEIWRSIFSRKHWLALWGQHTISLSFLFFPPLPHSRPSPLCLFHGFTMNLWIRARKEKVRIRLWISSTSQEPPPDWCQPARPRNPFSTSVAFSDDTVWHTSSSAPRPALESSNNVTLRRMRVRVCRGVNGWDWSDGITAEGLS